MDRVVGLEILVRFRPRSPSKLLFCLLLGGLRFLPSALEENPLLKPLDPTTMIGRWVRAVLLVRRLPVPLPVGASTFTRRLALLAAPRREAGPRVVARITVAFAMIGFRIAITIELLTIQSRRLTWPGPWRRWPKRKLR